MILVLAFAGLAVYLFHEGRLFQSQAISVLGVVFAYLLGVVARIRSVRGWEDLKAGVVLLVLLYTAGAYLLDRQQPRAPSVARHHPRAGALLLRIAVNACE